MDYMVARHEQLNAAEEDPNTTAQSGDK